MAAFFGLVLAMLLAPLVPDAALAGGVIAVETYSDRTAFEARLGGQTRVVTFDDIDTSKKELVTFPANRYKASQGVVIMGEGSQYASRDFYVPTQFIPTSAPNEYAPGPKSKKLEQGGNNTDVRFFDGTNGALVAGVGIVFIDADFPLDGPSSLEILSFTGNTLGNSGTVSGPNASQIFSGLVTTSAGIPVAAIASARIVSGNGWLGNDNNEGVALDDLVFGIPAAGQSTPCPLAARTDCRTPTKPRTSTLALVDSTNDAKDAVTWKWGSGAATTKDEFGDPTVAAAYGLCIYSNGALAMAASAPAGGVCGRKHCWVSAGTGFTYADKERSPDGLQSGKLTPGADGKAAVAFAGKGPTLPLPTLPLAAPVVVHAVRSDGGPCWSATFGTLAKNTATMVKAKSD